MYPISNYTAATLRKPEREFLTKCLVDGVEYKQDMMIDFAIENSLSLSNQLELGTVIPSKLTIKYRMLEQFGPNARIVPYIAVVATALTWQDADISWNDAAVAWNGGVSASDWMPLGEFYVDQRERVGDVWTYTCYDKLIFGDVPYISALNFPNSMKAVWNEICTRLGFSYDNSVQINPAYMISTAPTGYSMRQVMMHICSAHAACAYIDKAGMLKWRVIHAAEQPVLEMGLRDHVRVKQTNPVKTYSRVVVTYNEEDDLSYVAGTGGDGSTMYVICPFATQQITNNLLAAINGYSYQPVSLTPRGYPHLDQGDRLRFAVQSSVSWNDATISWDDADFPWDGYLHHETIILHQELRFKGGFSMQIEAPSISEQQSEFVVDGSLSGAIKQVNKTALKEGRRYYGASINRTDGLVIEREGGAAKAVFNADELTFYQGGNKALWFDVPNNRYKFSGTLEAVDGVFSGNLQAAGGSFTGELIAATGTFSGNLSAAGGTFKGALQAASGTFTGDLSAAGGTFKGALQAASGSFTGELIAASGTFKGALQAATGSFSGTLDAATIKGGTIEGTNIFGATIKGGTITSDTTINVTTDAIIGRGLVLSGAGPKVVSFGSSGRVEGINDQTLSMQSSANLQFIAPSMTFFGNVNFSLASVTGLGAIEAQLSALSSRITALGG
jgi:hypothetical protein